MRTVERRGANHTLHLILSLLTCGLWAVTGWPVAALMGRKTVTHVSGPGQPGEMIWNPYSERWVPRG